MAPHTITHCINDNRGLPHSCASRVASLAWY